MIVRLPCKGSCVLRSLSDVIVRILTNQVVVQTH